MLGCEENRTLSHHWWECKLVLPLCRKVWRFLRKTKNRVKKYTPKKTIICKNICTPMFITTRFIIDKTWKQPKCISKSGLRRYSTSYNGILFSHKKNKIMKFTATRDDHIQWSHRKINTIYHLHVEFKIWHKWTYLKNRNRFTDIENRLVVAKAVEGWRRLGLGV